MSRRPWGTSLALAALLAAPIACKDRKAEEQSADHAVQASQKRAEEALDQAKEAQEKARSEQKDVAKADKNVAEQERDLAEAQKKAATERAEAQQAQATASQTADQAHQVAGQAQQEAAQGQAQGTREAASATTARASEETARAEQQKGAAAEAAKPAEPTPAPAPPSDLQKVSGTEAKPATPPANNPLEVSGRVTSATADTVVLERTGEPPLSLKVQSSTTITQAGATKSAADLAAGTEVKAKYRVVDNQPVADSIEAR